MFSDQCDQYLNERTGTYETRSVRYERAAEALTDMGLDHDHTLIDVGAGSTEFDYCLRTHLRWRGRYIPLDGCIDNTNIEDWYPPREYDFAVALELLEHLHDPARLVRLLKSFVRKGIVVSVPNPRTVDVIGIDRTHVTVVTADMLVGWGFKVVEATFYGGVYSHGQPDALFGVWSK